jgi:hypothetical protein
VPARTEKLSRALPASREMEDVGFLEQNQGYIGGSC